MDRSPSTPIDTIPEFLTRPAAARQAGIGLRPLRKATESGEVPLYQIGTWPRVRWREVLDWIERQRTNQVVATSDEDRTS